MNFLIPLVALFGTAALFLLVIYPSLNNLPTLREDLEANMVIDDKLTNKLANLNRLVDFQASVDENAELVESALVSEPAVPELLTQVDALAVNSGLEVTKLSYSFGGSGTGEVEEVKPYELVNVTLGARGNFEQLKAFMTALENSARLVGVENFRYTQFEEEEFSGLDITLVLSSPYLFIESTAVTDTPIDLDISSTEFLTMMERIKELNFFEPSVDTTIELVEEESPENLEEGLEVPEGEPIPVEELETQPPPEESPPISVEDGSLP